MNKTTTYNSKGQTEETLTYYANDYDNAASPNVANLKAIHAIGVPLKTTKIIDNQLVDGILAETDAAGNPTKLYRYANAPATPTAHNANLFLETGYALSESRKYSTTGNITEIIPRKIGRAHV